MAATRRATRSRTAPTETQDYYLRIAHAVRLRASCDKRLVGAVLVQENRIISTGYNGTPEGMTNCNQNGCYRCAHPDMYESGEGYDVCICVHAEQNALLTAARFGIGVGGSDIYTTLAPCFTCMKELLQANVKNVFYLGKFRKYDNDLDLQVKHLVRQFRENGGKAQRIVIPDINPNLSREDLETSRAAG
jgi:dCMP deaminase